MSASEPNGVVGVRLTRLERDVDELSQLRPVIVQLVEHVREAREDIADAKAENRGTRRALWAAAFSVTTGAVIFAVTSFTVFGGAGG